MNRVPTGITDLDELIDGGFPRPATIGIMGDVGSGKSILCNQVAWNMLRKGFNVLYYTLDQSFEDVIVSMDRFGWSTSEFLKNGQLRFVDVFSKGMELIAEKTKENQIEDIAIDADRMGAIPISLRDMIMMGREHYFKAVFGRDLLIVFDSLSPLFSMLDQIEVLKFLRAANYACRISNGIGIATLHTGIHSSQVENACQQIADGVIEMRRVMEGGSILRTVRIVKMSKTKIFEEYCPIEITSTGVVVHRIPIGLRR